VARGAASRPAPRPPGPSASRRPARRRSSGSWGKRDSVVRHHSSRGAVARALERPTRTHRASRPRTRPYLGLHRVGFTLFTPAARGGDPGGGGPGLCGTFRRLAPPRRYLAPCPAVSRLSSRGGTTRSAPPAMAWRSRKGLQLYRGRPGRATPVPGLGHPPRAGSSAPSPSTRGRRGRRVARRWRGWPSRPPRHCRPAACAAPGGCRAARAAPSRRRAASGGAAW
jgi:hypothetical protein